MNAEYGDITRTSPEARLVKTCGATASAIPSSFGRLAGCELVTDDLPLPDGDDQPAQHPLPILTAGLERRRAPVLRHATRLVDVAVEPYRRLVRRERVGHSLRTGAVVDGLLVLDDGRRRPHRRVELQARVQGRVERRAMEVE